jgi:Fe-S-cluster containining protein
MRESASARTEFDFDRTECACADCIKNCLHIPGYLNPADVKRIGRHLGYTSLFKFAFDYLLASPGATVMQAGRIFQIPTLVPRRKADGSCIFLDENNRCRIHEVSPFGCAFFDAHQSHAEADERSSRGLQEIALQWAMHPLGHAYTIIWRMLHIANLRAMPAHLARAHMAQLSAAADENEEEAVGTEPSR